jgi:hypothetical protein
MWLRRTGIALVPGACRAETGAVRSASSHPGEVFSTATCINKKMENTMKKKYQASMCRAANCPIGRGAGVVYEVERDPKIRFVPVHGKCVRVSAFICLCLVDLRT